MPHARISDPVTSYLAAASVNSISETKQAILSILKRPCTDEQLLSEYVLNVMRGNAPAASDSGIRSRRAELVKLGLVFDTGERSKMSSGRQAIVWQSTTDIDNYMEPLF